MTLSFVPGPLLSPPSPRECPVFPTSVPQLRETLVFLPAGCSFPCKLPHLGKESGSIHLYLHLPAKGGDGGVLGARMPRQTAPQQVFQPCIPTLFPPTSSERPAWAVISVLQKTSLPAQTGPVSQRVGQMNKPHRHLCHQVMGHILSSDPIIAVSSKIHPQDSQDGRGK
jgi:hypothetical protein